MIEPQIRTVVGTTEIGIDFAVACCHKVTVVDLLLVVPVDNAITIEIAPLLQGEIGNKSTVRINPPALSKVPPGLSTAGV